MASGICYTQSGNVKRYEVSCLGDIPKTIEIYNVDPDIKCIHHFSIIPYPPPPGYPEVQGFTEGTAHWISEISYNNIEESLIPYIPTPSYTPPKGYTLSNKGIYTYTYNCTYYFYPKPYNIIYGDKVRTIENEESMFAISKDFEFKYSINYTGIITNISTSNNIVINGIHCEYFKNNYLSTFLFDEYNNQFNLDINIGLNKEYNNFAFDIEFVDNVNYSSIPPDIESINLLINGKEYNKTNDYESLRCKITTNKNYSLQEEIGTIYTTGGSDYTIEIDNDKSASIVNPTIHSNILGNYQQTKYVIYCNFQYMDKKYKMKITVNLVKA